MELFATETYGKCPDCNNERFAPAWCTDCDVENLKEKSRLWTSGNIMLDDFIRNTQLNAKHNRDFFEWINFDDFELVRSLGKGSFSTTYTAIWLEGPKLFLDEGTQKWLCSGPTEVVLKRLDNSLNLSQEYINQLYKYHKVLQHESLADVFAITKDQTSNYVIVMGYYSSKDLYSYMDEVFGILCWTEIIDILWSISLGLEHIHNNNLIHGNLHGGNILIRDDETIVAKMADVGLHGPADKKPFDQKIYGVIPFVAPEIFYNQTPTKASDVYSFGMIMWMLASGVRPYYDKDHDYQLITKIKNGLRPHHVNIKDAPLVYRSLMEKCLDLNPHNRPKSSELRDAFEDWAADCSDSEPNDVCREFDVAENTKISNHNFIANTPPRLHPGAVYFSRPLG